MLKNVKTEDRNNKEIKEINELVRKQREDVDTLIKMLTSMKERA